MLAELLSHLKKGGGGILNTLHNSLIHICKNMVDLMNSLLNFLKNARHTLITLNGNHISS